MPPNKLMMAAIPTYLNMSGDGIEPPSIQDDAAAEQSANVHITTIFTCIEHHIFI